MSKIIAVSTLACLCLTTTVFAQDMGKIAQANFSAAKGQAAYESGKYNEAVESLENAIKIRPEHARAHYYLALSYERLGKKDDAVKLLDSYLNYVQQTTEWPGSMDKEYIGKCKELSIQLKQVSEETAKEAYNKGVGYLNKGDYDQAIVEFTKAIKIRPDLAEIYAVRAVAYAKKGSFDLAIVDCNKTIEINPNSALAYNSRAEAYFGKKDYGKAWEDVHKVESMGGTVDPRFIEELKKLSGRDK